MLARPTLRARAIALLLLLVAQPAVARAECQAPEGSTPSSAAAAGHDGHEGHGSHASHDAAAVPASDDTGNGDHDSECTMAAPCTGWSIAANSFGVVDASPPTSAPRAAHLDALISASASVDTPPPRA